MTITIGGLASGLDTSSIVQALMGVAQIPLVQLQSEQANASNAAADLSSFMSTVSSLQTAVQGLETPADFNALTATSTADGVSASVLGDAEPGSFAVQVTNLATEQRTESDPQSSSTDALAQTGALTIQVGTDTPVSVSVASDDSLTSIATNINASGAAVTASVIYDGSQYRLLVRGAQTGADNAVTFAESGTSLGLSTPANTYQPAQDASLTVDNQEVTSPTNVVTDAIPGVTLNLTGKSTAPGTVTVATDPTALATSIGAVVTAYNNMVASAQTTAGYGTVAAQNTLLQSDSAIRQTTDQLSAIMSDVVPGSSGAYTTLASVGLNLDSDGTLSFDQTTFDTALQTDPTGVASLFVTDPTTGATGAMGLLDSTITSLTSGTNALLESRMNSFTTDATQYGTDATNLQAQLSTYQTTLQNEFTQLEVSLAQTKTETATLNAIFDSSTNGSGTSTTSGGSSTSSGFVSLG